MSPEPTRLLFVCLGNICRSPAAEGVFLHLLAREGLETAACVPSQPGLDEALCEQGYPGIGGASVLIVGLPRVAARDLGRRLRQRAVIFHQRGRETELVFAG